MMGKEPVSEEMFENNETTGVQIIRQKLLTHRRQKYSDFWLQVTTDNT